MDDQINLRSFNLSDTIIRQTERINSGEAGANATPAVQGESFREVLSRQLGEGSTVSFSKHANQRTEERNISISQTELERLGAACDKAEQKGIRDALVMMDDSAFIVNARNRVVITVMDRNELKDNVFTNIDGAVFV